MLSVHTTDIFIVKLRDKEIDSKKASTFLRTENRFFDITGCHPLTGGSLTGVTAYSQVLSKYGIDTDEFDEEVYGVLPAKMLLKQRLDNYS